MNQMKSASIKMYLSTAEKMEAAEVNGIYLHLHRQFNDTEM